MSGSARIKSYRPYAIGFLALLTGSLLLAASLLLARGRDNQPVQVLPPASGDTPVSARPGGATSPVPAPEAAELKIYVEGAVRNPGVYALQAGDRLTEALAAAGGATGEADLAAVNLALRVRDEGYYYIPRSGETPPPLASPLEDSDAAGSPASSGGGGGSPGLLDLNAASLDELSALPGIGPVRGQAIIDYRDHNGGFTSVVEIMNVPGIGPATYEKVRGLVTAGAP